MDPVLLLQSFGLHPAIARASMFRCRSSGQRFGRAIATFATFATLMLAALLARAQSGAIAGYPDTVQAYDAREVALLPPYCKYTQEFRSRVPGGSDREELNRWRSLLGETLEHLHHYCWGMMKTNRAVLMARDQKTRLAYLRDAVNEFDYVLRRLPPDYVLLPEALTKKGENLVKLGNGPGGLLQFEQAIEAKPDYWPPYAYISDYYRDAGSLTKAREALTRGLTQVPDAPALKRRLVELDQQEHSSARNKAPTDKVSVE